MLVALDLALSPPSQAVVAGTREADDVQRWNARLHQDLVPRRASREARRSRQWLHARAEFDVSTLPPADYMLTVKAWREETSGRWNGPHIQRELAAGDVVP
jgi:hypothetical protein